MPLGGAVTAFVDSHILSVDDLRIFFACADNPDRWWSSTALGRELGVAERIARATLERFAQQNLLDIRISDDVRYRFQPGTGQLEAAASAFAAAYRRDPALVVQYVARSAAETDSLRDFADAFRIRRRDDR
jgi:hypothetical protein